MAAQQISAQKLAAALQWARSLQQLAPVSPHHERAVAELWPWLSPLGIRSALEVGAGEPPYLSARMLREHGITTTTLDGLSDCDVQADMHDLPFDDDSFDLVVGRHCLEHVLIPYLALMEMRRVSKRWLLVVVPWLSEKAVNWPDHLHAYVRTGWERMFAEMRLRVVRYEEGDHTEQYALDNGLWADREWRYLLTKEDVCRTGE